MAETLSSKTVTTKKPHTCFSCLRSFPIGTKMNYWVGISDGFSAVYSCMTCVEIMNMDSDTEFPEGYVSDMLSDGQTPEKLLKEFRGEAVAVELLGA